MPRKMGKERVRCFVPEGSQKRKATRVRSLRQRWIVNSVVPIFVLLALIVGGVSLGISNYYYKGMLDGLERQARAQSGAFVDYFMDQGFANYLQRANQAISDYADKERVEMQFLSSVGRIQASSTSNLTVGTRPGTEDISRAVETNRISYFRGADPKTGEQILAVSHPLTVNGKVVGVLRFVTSLRQVNVQVRMTVLAVVLVALLCLLLVLSSNLIFINNVVEPVAVVSDAAKRISQGSYGFTLENKYTGELGELVDNINDMSMKIGQNEKMKTEFISSVSHELRTPVAVILAECDSLDHGQPTEEDYRQSVDVIRRQGQQMSRLIGQLLHITRLEQGTQKLQLETADLSQLVEVLCEEEAHLAPEGTTLAVHTQPDLLVNGDVARLSRLLTNLISNAYRYGKPNGHVWVDLRREDRWAVLSVRDDGIGIAPEDRERIFQRFYQVDAARGKDGSGLGLFMVQQAARLHGGSVTVDSRIGEGSTFIVRLPLAE